VHTQLFVPELNGDDNRFQPITLEVNYCQLVIARIRYRLDRRGQIRAGTGPGWSRTAGPTSPGIWSRVERGLCHSYRSSGRLPTIQKSWCSNHAP